MYFFWKEETGFGIAMKITRSRNSVSHDLKHSKGSRGFLDIYTLEELSLKHNTEQNFS